MAADKDVNFSVGVDNSAAEQEFEKLAQQAMTTGQKIQSSIRDASNRMQAGFKENTDKMNSNFDGLKSKIEGLRGQLVALAGVALAGRWLKSASDDAANMAVEHTKLAAQLGVSTSEVQVLDMALGDVHGTIEELKSAHTRINNELLTNEDSFKKLGVATRDSNGNFRSTMSVMTDTNAALLKFREGTDRNVEGMKVYGKQWPELMHLVNLTGDMLDDAAADAQKFGLVIGVENVAAAKAYQQATGDVADMLTGLRKVIGDAVMPVLTQLSQWLVTIAPNAIAGLKVSIGTLISLFWGLRMVIDTVIQLAMMQFERLGARISQVVNVTMRAIQGDWSGAKAAWDAGQAELEAINKKRFGNIADIAEDTRNKIFNLFSDPTPFETPDGGGATSAGADPKQEKTANRSSDFEAKLQDLKAAFAQEQLAQGAAHEFGKAQERDYWKNILDTVKLSQDERRSVMSKYIALEQDLQKGVFEQHIASMQQDLAETAAGGTERIRIAAEIAADIGKQYGLESQQYQQALGIMQQAAREHQNQMAQIEQLAQDRRRSYQLGQLELERMNLDQQLAMGDINNQQRLAQLALLKEQEYQIELEAAMERAALMENDAIAYQQAMDKVLEVKRKHELDKRGIENEIAKQSKADYDAAFAPITTAFNKSITGMIQGTTTLREATRNTLINIAAEYANTGVRIAINWIANEARKTMATAAGASTRTSIETAAAAQSTALSGSSTLVSIMNDAYEAMAAAYASISAIPIVGPFMAPAVAAGAFTVVAGLAGSVASAEGGYDIPGGVNPMTQLHEREMVLPSQHADVIRALGERGGVADGGTGRAPVVVRGMSTGDWMFLHRKDFVKALGAAGREFIK